MKMSFRKKEEKILSNHLHGVLLVNLHHCWVMGVGNVLAHMLLNILHHEQLTNPIIANFLTSPNRMSISSVAYQHL